MSPRNTLWRSGEAYEDNKGNYNPEGKNYYSEELRANTKVKEKPPEEHRALGQVIPGPKGCGAAHSSKGVRLEAAFYSSWVLVAPLDVPSPSPFL